MNRLVRGLAALGVVAVLVGGATARAVTDHGDRPADGSAASTSASAAGSPSGARTELAGLTPASGDPVPAGIETAAPSAGQVGRLAGPFDDRFQWRNLALQAGRVTGALTVTSDVSDLLELQVVAGFYDAKGHYLGLARYTHHFEETGHSHTGPPSEHEGFTIRAPASIRDRVATASISVPVLVNE